MTDFKGTPPQVQLDLPILEQLARDTDPSLVPELLAMFLADGRQRVLDIESALAADDDASLAAAAHALGGSMATFGLSAVSPVVQQCEASMRSGDTVLGKEQARQILVLAPAAFEAIAEYAASLNP